MPIFIALRARASSEHMPSPPPPGHPIPSLPTPRFAPPPPGAGQKGGLTWRDGRVAQDGGVAIGEGPGEEQTCSIGCTRARAALTHPLPAVPSCAFPPPLLPLRSSFDASASALAAHRRSEKFQQLALTPLSLARDTSAAEWIESRMMSVEVFYLPPAMTLCLCSALCDHPNASSSLCLTRPRGPRPSPSCASTAALPAVMSHETVTAAVDCGVH